VIRIKNIILFRSPRLSWRSQFGSIRKWRPNFQRNC